MTLPSTRRRVALLLAALTVPALAVAAPVPTATAAEACLTEVVTGASLGNPGSRCDDVSPPVTAVTDAEPHANRNRYLAQDHIKIFFTGTHSDADADPISFECQLFTTTEAPTTWDACSSPATYTDLADTDAAPYTFQVRAVDGADRGIDATAGGGLLQPTPADTDLADYDETPAAASFFVDTAAPNTFVFDEPFDEVTPEYPMLTQRRLTVDIASNEPDVTYVCSVKGKRAACAGNGSTTFTGLAPGDQALRVTAIDPAGNVDATPTYTPFSVPTNLGVRHATAAGGWKRVAAGGGYYGADFLSSTRAGATLVLKATRAKELRVIAPTGPRLGRVEIQVGALQAWVPLSQVGSAEQRFDVVYQRFFGRQFSGRISLRVVNAGKARPAKVDAVLLR